MRRTNARHALALAALVSGFGFGVPACLISIDESLVEEGDNPPPDDVDADSSVHPEGGDTGSDIEAPEADGAPDAGDAQPDALGDGPQEADVSTDVHTDVEAPDGDGGEAEAGSADVEAGDPFDTPPVECYDDSWCPPVGCTLRRCDEGACVTAGPMHEEVTTLSLPSPLACSQNYKKTCLVASRDYLFALTTTGLVVFNTHNPHAVKQETIPSNIGGDYAHLVRSGERIWASKGSEPTYTDFAWFEVPLDNRSPFSPPTTKSLFVPPISARFAAPYDALFLYRYDDSVPAAYVARYTPGLLTTPALFLTAGALETDAVASSGGRILLHELVQHTVQPDTYRHRFSLQSDPASTMSENGGSYEEDTLTSSNATFGYFASSRAGAIAWVVGRKDDQDEWRDVRVYWLVANASAGLEPASLVIEMYATQPEGVPQGPLAFIDNDTVATAVISGGVSPAPSLVIVRRQGTNPLIIKRIPTSPLAAGALSVAADHGYAYLAAGNTVRMFAPSCAP